MNGDEIRQQLARIHGSLIILKEDMIRSQCPARQKKDIIEVIDDVRRLSSEIEANAQTRPLA
ncbi:MAG: hypothetical protein E5Y73_09695 [Mesorhizobium sp.]|uniref:hypothetical protein n=1 Tax=Mesorhizobium sp. TaxID=1871066 RepID=UPI00120FA12F|nr:hypothetical protein [Mesorhizobium sp.]TIL94798.1 MAG: hypothetical protein E5Y73_09695 [Mesorhizobium sp.]